MKNYFKYIQLLLILGFSTEMYPQTSDPSAVYFSKNKNYIVTLTPRKETSSVAYLNDKVTNYEGANVQVSIQYMDGMGRPDQEVKYQASPLKKDLVSVQEYSALTFLEKSWLPAVISTKGSYWTPGSVMAQAKTDNSDAMPYSSFLYEEPVYMRKCEEYGPGQQWYNYRRPVKTEYLTNIAADASLNCILYKVNGTGKNTTLAQSGNYPSGDLFIVRTTDEDQNQSYSFSDKLGRQLLTRQVSQGVNHDTYYVYDDFNNLCFVLSPNVQDKGNEEDIKQNRLDELAYQYKYDFRNRCVSKKLPGSTSSLYVYDKADQLIFSQDGNQKSRGEWSFSIPDALGRTVITGTCSDTIPVTGKNVKAEFASNGTYKGYNIQVSGSVRQLTGYKLLSVNYYDNYDYQGKNNFPIYSYDSSKESSGFGKRFNASTGYEAKGLLTGRITAVLEKGGAEMLYTTNYYDNRSQLIQRHVSNYLDGKEVEYVGYNFVGQTIKQMHVHTASGKPTRTETYTYDYDHTGRLLTIKYKLDALSEVLLVNNTYDELGRLSSKSFHGAATKTLTYAYNVRSWLTGITGAKFSQNLYYADGTNTTKCFNGNISSMTWKGSDGVVRGYKMNYDGLSRMTNAIYGETSAISSNLDRFTEKISGYDKNGNIKALQRYGQTSASAYGLIDNLTFTLNGNQLNRVDDAVAASAYNNSFEFKDAVKQAGEYAYDANGNLTKDLNKDITGITYNVLNLPSVVTFKDGSTITYTYTADGTKLRTINKIGSASTTTDYCGNVIYENSTAKQLLIEGGYVSLSDNKFHYYLKDHQGNNRAVINQTGTTAEETNHYYPFGGVFASSENVQPYKYNGKEYDAKKGLNWYDYGARRYDAALGRFITVDPLAEKYYPISSYIYCLNNPIKYIDAHGMTPRIYVETNGVGHTFITTGQGLNTTVYTYGRYGGINGEKSSARSLSRNGEGVLIILKGNDAIEYIKNEVLSKEARIYEITSGSDDKIDSHFKKMFDSSDNKPSAGKYKNANNAKVVDTYDLWNNNCTTKSAEAIEVGTDGSFVLDSSSPSNIDTKLYYENKKQDSQVNRIDINKINEEYNIYEKK